MNRYFICETCGTQVESHRAPDVPEQCVICQDERQYVGWGGQRWTTMADLVATHRNRLEMDDGLLGVGLSGNFGIHQRALVLPTEGPKILWETVSLVTPEAVDHITKDGPVHAIAISHPHFYGCMVEWSEALGGVPIFLHEADRQWILRTSSNIQLWSGDDLTLSPGVRLIRSGGHFAGSTVLHWKDAQRPRGALFSGDAPQVVANRRQVSFMYSYPNLIPMQPDDVENMRRIFEPYEFEDVYGYTWGRNIIGNGRAAMDTSFDRYLHAIAAA